jgi:hypothetical protein
VAAAGLLPLLAGCGGSTGGGAGADVTSVASSAAKTATAADGSVQLTVPDGADDQTKKQYLMENALASCMKRQGFTYTPHVFAPAPSSMTSVDGEDYAAAKKYRQKYGFGYYAGAAYPDDPKAPNSKKNGNGKQLTPSDDDEKGFTPAQLKAYDAALMGPPAKSKAEEKIGGCQAKADAVVNGPPLSAAAQLKAQHAREEENRENGQALNGDAQLVQLAQRYAACLRDQGIPVSTTQPTGMADMVRIDISSKLPETFHDIPKDEALPLLTQDIGVALKDLECGKEFRAAYFPKLKAHPYWGAGA